MIKFLIFALATIISSVHAKDIAEEVLNFNARLSLLDDIFKTVPKPRESKEPMSSEAKEKRIKQLEWNLARINQAETNQDKAYMAFKDHFAFGPMFGPVEGWNEFYQFLKRERVLINMELGQLKSVS